MIVLKRFTGFAYGRTNPAPPMWVNPDNIAYCEARLVRTAGDDAIDGTRIYFQHEAGVLDVRESLAQVVDSLTGNSWRREVKEHPEYYGAQQPA